MTFHPRVVPGFSPDVSGFFILLAAYLITGVFGAVLFVIRDVREVRSEFAKVPLSYTFGLLSEFVVGWPIYIVNEATMRRNYSTAVTLVILGLGVAYALFQI